MHSNSTSGESESESEKKYKKSYDYWKLFRHINFKTCQKCNVRKILPCYASYSLPIKPMWTREKIYCMVCESI